jgi:hypothetical protein
VDIGQSATIRLEEAIVARQKERALSSLGIDGSGEETIGSLDYRMAPTDILHIGYYAARSVVG